MKWKCFSLLIPPPHRPIRRARLPVAIVPPFAMMPERSVPLPFIAPLFETISKWTQLNNPDFDADSEYNLRLEIFGENFRFAGARRRCLRSTICLLKPKN